MCSYAALTGRSFFNFSDYVASHSDIVPCEFPGALTHSRSAGHKRGQACCLKALKVLVTWTLLPTYKTPFQGRRTTTEDPQQSPDTFQGHFHVSFTLFALEIQYEVHCYQISSRPRSRFVVLLSSLHMTPSAGQITRPLDISLAQPLNWVMARFVAHFQCLVIQLRARQNGTFSQCQTGHKTSL